MNLVTWINLIAGAINIIALLFTINVALIAKRRIKRAINFCERGNELWAEARRKEVSLVGVEKVATAAIEAVKHWREYPDVVTGQIAEAVDEWEASSGGSR